VPDFNINRTYRVPDNSYHPVLDVSSGLHAVPPPLVMENVVAEPLAWGAGEIFNFSPRKGKPFGTPLLVWRLDPTKARNLDVAEKEAAVRRTAHVTSPICGEATARQGIEDTWDLAIQVATNT
jgi:hypothetical protein